jgi:putative membrane-bound dehydrogenase-like protein
MNTGGVKMTPREVASPKCWAAFLVALGIAGIASADFPTPHDSETDLSRQRLSPEEAAAGFRVPEGFTVNVFAAEPEVMNPIAVTWDTRGRLWVAENFTYAERPRRLEGALRDRVLVLADTDGDGRADERRVFSDTLEQLTGLEVGLGGVWLMCPPRLLFVPDRDRNDVPDGPPEAVLDGFTVPAENHHNFANGLRFGPDGWLYGRCGGSAPGLVRRADAPDAYAVPVRGGMWRYHPTTRQFEALCHGTTNPWGHDWDAHGEGFFINTVNGHLWHLIPGAHFTRVHTLAASPLVYAPIEMHADHWHWDTGKSWTDSRSASGEHDRLGGGHAHVGMTIYGGLQWPEAYRGRLFTLNQHGRRMNVERLEREGSGYVARHEPDMLHAADPWMRGVEVTYGPDGSVMLVDWSDTGECHENTGVHRTSGRIFRVAFGRPEPRAPRDLTRDDPVALAAAFESGDEWLARAARRELCDRAAIGRDVEPAVAALTALVARGGDVVPRLRALWTLHGLGRRPTDAISRALADSDEHVRTWGVRLATDDLPLDLATGVARAKGTFDPARLDPLVRRAREETSGLVRLALASSLERLPIADRVPLAAALLAHGEDATDHNLPALIWFGLMPLAAEDPATLVPLALDGAIPRVREWTARRVGELAARRPELVDALLERAASRDRAVKADVIAGLAAGLEGQRRVPRPSAWEPFVASLGEAGDLAPRLRAIGVVFGDGVALDEVRRLALDGRAQLPVRRQALESLIDARPDDLRDVCERLLGTRGLATTALAGLTRFDDPAVGATIAKSYARFDPVDRPAVIAALASRPSFAVLLVGMLEAGTIARGDVTAAQARQIRDAGDAALAERLARSWGELRDSPREKQETIESLRRQLAPERLATASPARGRSVFAKHCGTCHRLFGTGGVVGPDLTGGDRMNLDYVLSNVVDPGAVVTKDFLVTRFLLADGRVVVGIVAAENEAAVTVQTAQDRQTIPRGDIESREPSRASLMPDGLLQPLAEQEIVDLVAYLRSAAQVEPAAP